MFFFGKNTDKAFQKNCINATYDTKNNFVKAASSLK